MRTLVIGAGATGGYFGARLADAGRDITFLVRPRRAEQLRATGLVVHSPHGDLTLAPRVVTAAELDAGYDLVLVTVKAYALEGAIADMAPAVGPDTMVMPVLNGMRHLDPLVERFGDGAVLGGVAMIASTIEQDGSIRQLTGMQQLVYGDRQDPGSARIDAVDGTLRGAGFGARLSAAIVAEMWEKWAFLAGLGAITCLMRGTIGQVVDAPGGLAFAEGVVAECAAVTRAAGYPLTVAASTRIRGSLTEAGSPAASSMYRDLQQGNPVEADHIMGDLVDRARRLGVPVPLLEATYTHLSVYGRARGRP